VKKFVRKILIFNNSSEGCLCVTTVSNDNDFIELAKGILEVDFLKQIFFRKLIFYPKKIKIKKLMEIKEKF
jgi:hypothetical protein